VAYFDEGLSLPTACALECFKHRQPHPMAHGCFYLLFVSITFAAASFLNDCERQQLAYHDENSADFASRFYRPLEAPTDVIWNKWDFAGTIQPKARAGMVLNSTLPCSPFSSRACRLMDYWELQSEISL